MSSSSRPRKGLTLTRKLGERVFIIDFAPDGDDDITVEVTRIDSKQVRLRFNAPGREILREELIDGSDDE